MIYVKYIAVLLPILLIVDAFWIAGVAGSFYKNNLGYIMSGSINWLPALLFYVLYIFGLVYFIILPGQASGDIWTTIMRGALFGLIAYGTYDLTNHATLRDWPPIVTFVDMAWGTFLTGLLSGIGHYISKWIV